MNLDEYEYTEELIISDECVLESETQWGIAN